MRRFSVKRRYVYLTYYIENIMYIVVRKSEFYFQVVTTKLIFLQTSTVTELVKILILQTTFISEL